MSDRTLLIKEFQDWREANGLGFDKAFLPKRFEDMRDLEVGYWKAEDAAKDAETKGAAPAAPDSRMASRDWVNAEILKTCENLGAWLAKELNTLRDRIKVLEDTPAELQYRGVWKPGASYSKNMATTCDGAIWVARRDYPEDKPGVKRGHWQLAVKTPKDVK
jgi:hypothetical protein